MSILRRVKKTIKGEKGQALPIVLALMAVGGLVMSVSLNHVTSSLKSSGIIVENTQGIYAAESGMEYALWTLKNGQTPPATLSENISGMSVGLTVEDNGAFTLYAGELLEEAGAHYDWITVNTTISGIPGSTCNFTISITREEEASGVIRLVEVGAAFPAGYDYVTNSAALFPGNIETDEPDSSGETYAGVHWVQWEWNPGQGPELTDNVTLYQTFQIAGTGSLVGDYSWVQVQSNDIGIVGEISGNRYTVTATATDPVTGEVTGRIKSNLLIVGGTIQILSWNISK